MSCVKETFNRLAVADDSVNRSWPEVMSQRMPHMFHHQAGGMDEPPASPPPAGCGTLPASQLGCASLDYVSPGQ